MLDDESATDEELRTRFSAHLETELQRANDFFERALRRHFEVAQNALGGLESTQPRLRSRSDAGMSIDDNETVMHASSKSFFALQQYSFATRKAFCSVGIASSLCRSAAATPPLYRCCEKPPVD
jgi:hypothetical protein